MDSSASASSISSLGTAEATQLLKEMLNVGKRVAYTASASETSTASLASNMKDDVQDTSMGNGDGRSDFLSMAESGLKSYTSEVESDGEVRLSTNHPAGENGSHMIYGSGNEADQSQSFQVDDEDEPGEMIGQREEDQVENGHASLSELLKTMGKQVLTKQQIILPGDDIRNSFSVYGREVDIVSSAVSGSPTQTAGSNKVKINPVVNFDWDHKHYVGNLVAVHRNGIHVAYVLRGKSGGIVRVINRKTAERALLRGFTGNVVDISFAHLSPIVLGTVDEIGNMFIYEVLEGPDGKIDTTVLLQVVRPADTPVSNNHRLIWCPYIPDDEESSGTTANTTTDSSVVEDVGKLLVLTHNEVAEMWNVDLVTRSCGSGPFEPSEIENGLLTITSHTAPIIDASFSPDGSALATASLDGQVKFFQVYMHDKGPPRCLHEWQPHGGSPVSSLFFLDDHKHPNPEVQFWKFAVTGADNNREIKVWSCESWICLQTIHILPAPDLLGGFQVEPCLKAQMDLAANFLILSDIQRKVLYIMQVYTDEDNSRAHICSVSEFLLTQPCLSFSVLDASRRKFTQSLDQHDSVADLTTGELGIDEEEEVQQQIEGPNVGILVKMYSVHTKVLQELQIRFKPESSAPQPPAASMSSFSHDDTGIKDHLSDMSMNTTMDSECRLDQPLIPVQVLPNDPPSSQDVSTSQSTPRMKDTPSDVSSVISSLPSPSQSAEQARAHAEAHLKELIKGGYTNIPGQGSPSPLKNTGQPRPLLMTPDSFLSSHRRDEGGVEDSVRSSGSSSFTHVTAMDDEQLRTPHGSVSHSHNHPSPGSSITLTPASSRDLSAQASPHPQTTPTSLPLPPPTPGEDVALTKESVLSPPGPSTPARSTNSNLAAPSQADSQEFYTSSPASHRATDFRPPVKSDSEVLETSDDTMDEMFQSDVAKPRQPLHSTGSSSSTSLEVLEILEGAKKPGHDIMYEEEDVDSQTPKQEHDAEPYGALQEQEGAPPEQESHGQILIPKLDLGMSEHEEDESERENESPRADTDERGEEREGSSVGGDEREEDASVKYDRRIWPKPPDPVQVEAHRLAAQAIIRASGMQAEVGPSGLPCPVGSGEDVVVEEIRADEENDVEIEEEHDEIIEEIENQEDGGEVIMHTHDRPHDRPHDRARDSPHHPPRIHSHYLSALQPATIEIPYLDEMKQSMQSMVSLLQTQQQEIEQLRSDIRVQQQATDTISSLQSHIANLESALTSRLTGALDQHSQSETQRLQQVLGQRDSQEQVKHDRMVNKLSQVLNNSLTSKLEKCVREEMNKSVVPSVTKILDPVKQQLHNDIAQKLTATDALMKENIGKLIRSRQTIEAIGGAAGNVIQGPVQAACRDVLIPSFDRACQNICHQVNQTFQRGTQEYTHQLEGHMEQVRRRHEESRDPVVHQLQAMVDAFKRQEEAHAPVYGQINEVTDSIKSCVTAIQSSHTRMETVIQQSNKGLQEFMVEQIKTIIEEQVVRALQEQQATISDQLMTAIRSQAPTPVPPTQPQAPDPQQLQAHVLTLLRQGQLNAAFQQALSASDLKLVMFVCETVDPVKVFNQSPCPLQQPVLLSLIQQLSAELNHNLELKHKYLEEAVMNLDQSNSVTKEHLPAVVGQLCQKLANHIQSNPNDPNTRQLKMLLRVSQALLK